MGDLGYPWDGSGDPGEYWRKRAEKAEAELARVRKAASSSLADERDRAVSALQNERARTEKAEAEVRRLRDERYDDVNSQMIQEYHHESVIQRERAEKAEAEVARLRVDVELLKRKGAALSGTGV